MRPGRLYRSVGEVLLAGVLCVALFVLAGMLAPIATNLMAGGGDLFSRRVVFDKEGVPRLEFRKVSYSHRTRKRDVTWYDLDGNEVGTFRERRAPRLRLGGIVDFNTVLRTGWRGGRRSDVTGWRYLPPPGAEVPIWHRLPYRGLLAGYLYPYGRPIGHIGREGFVEPGQAGTPFVNPRFIGSQPELGNVWIDGDCIYAIDLEEMTVLPLWKSSSGPIRALGYVEKMGIVLSGNTLSVIDASLQTKLEATLPEDLRNHVAWQVGWLKDRLVISNVSHRDVIVYHITCDGEVLDPWRLKVPLSPDLSRTRIVALTVASSIMSPWVGAGLQQFVEAEFPNAFRLVKRWLDWPYRPRFLAISLTVMFVSTLLTWWHLWRRSTPFQMMLGLIVTLTFSWPGHLVCRSLFDVAARVPCPTCRRRRPTDRPACPSCRTRWPSPTETGCEILLPAGSA